MNRAAVVLGSLLLAAAIASAALAAAEEMKPFTQWKDPDSYTFYPCTKCHAGMKVTGLASEEPVHGIDLGKGSHAGLYCVNCHSAPDVWNLKTRDGKVKIAIPGLHGREELMKLNKVCERCHPQTYMDYVHLAHANKTYTCPEGEAVIVKGYKGVGYTFHICSEYRNLSTVPAKACVECHDPHVGVMPPLNVLPPHDERPSPPPEDTITYGTLAVAIAGMSLIAGAVVLATHYTRGGEA